MGGISAAFGTGDVMLLGAGVGAIGNIMNANQAADTAEFNAKQSEQEAQIAKRRAEIEEQNFRYAHAKLLGTQRAKYGASGVTYSGSAKDVHQASVIQGERDAFRIKYQGLLNQNNAYTKAALSRLQGASARTAGYVNATAGFLNSYAKYSIYANTLSTQKQKPVINQYPGSDYGGN